MVLGAVLLQKESHGQEKAIVVAEKGYSQIEKEALGIIFAVKMFHRFIHGRSFTLQTNHRPFLFVLVPNWLQRYRTEVLYIKMEFFSSKRLGQAYWLSRLIHKLWEPLEETKTETLRLEIEIKWVLCNTIRELPVTINVIRNKAKIDKYLTEKKEKIIDQQF